jgi:hypothetical protein
MFSHEPTSRNVVAELAYLFRAEGQPPPVVLLGAGASYRSGIPLAAEAVKRIGKAAYGWNRLGLDEKSCNPLPSDWMPYLQGQHWFIKEPEKLAENFPLAVEQLLKPKDRRRRFLTELVGSRLQISEGYKALAQLMLRRLCKTVITTNFDRLVADALGELGPNVRDIIEVNRTADDIIRFSVFNEFQIIYLHGAVEFYRDQNCPTEIERLNTRVVDSIRPLLRDSPLVVVGYRGSEPSVMNHLLSEGIPACNDYPRGIYWCRRKGSSLHPNVEALKGRLGTNFYDLEIDGFDELFVQLNELLAGNARLNEASAGSGAKAGKVPFDHRPFAQSSMDNLDQSLLRSTLSQYFEKLKFGSLSNNSLEHVLVELQLVTRINNRTVPTVGGFLLFGRNVAAHFPFAKISVVIHGHRKVVVEGNLISQLETLTNLLSAPEINAIIRLKGETGSREEPAYSLLALREACVNLLIHRDYEAAAVATIEVVEGKHIRFINPGGLLSEVVSKVDLSADGTFTPRRGLTALRNPLLADIFYGIGRMDKAGSGLPDIARFMTERGGASVFSLLEGNMQVSVALLQALQEDSTSSRTAIARSPSEIFVTNLLPFSVLPECITFIPLRRKRVDRQKVDRAVRDALPRFIYHDDQLITFAAAECFRAYPEGELEPDHARSELTEELLSDPSKRSLFVWLLHDHWAHFLWSFAADGLTVESRSKRAYFVHKAPYATEVSTASYLSRMGRRIKRGVVKRRGTPEKMWHENEGIHYAAVSYGDEWALQIKPTYVFTDADGWTPLPPHAQARRATRRFKFDRNKSVDDDLTFWARYLSGAGPVIDLGGVGVRDLVLNASYIQAEAKTALLEAEI